jgi:tripartite-type tricarboxylate transporter receptor subunit TctC
MRYFSSARSKINGLAIFACILLAQIWSSPLAAQDYPNRRIVLVVPFSAGGVSDVLARALAQRMGDKLGQAVVVENRPGAAAAYEQVARSAPDGYTLMIGGNGITISAGLNKGERFDPRKDLTSIGRIATQPMILVARADLPQSTFAAFVSAAKGAPGKFSYASPGYGTPMHMAAELLGSEAGAKFLHVPYRGAVPAMTDIMSGQVDLYYGTETSAGPHITAGKMKALAVTSPQRLSAYPNIPTLTELGLPKASIDIWYGLFGSPNMEPGPFAKLTRVFAEVTESPDFKAQLAKLQLTPWVGTPADMKGDVDKEVPMWSDVARRVGIEPSQ